MQLLRIGRKRGWYLSWRDYTDDAFELQVIQENWLRWRLNVIRKSCGAGFLVTTSPEVLSTHAARWEYTMNGEGFELREREKLEDRSCGGCRTGPGNQRR